MRRSTGSLAVWWIVFWVGLWASSPLLPGQQAPPPVGQEETPVQPAPLQPAAVVQPMPGDNQAQPPPPADVSSPQPAGAGSEQPEPPAVLDPKTSLPLTPAELREREIDKFDPLKRNIDPVGTGNDPLADRKAAGAPDTVAAEGDTGRAAGAAAAPADGPVTSAPSGNRTSQSGGGVSGGSDTDLSDTAYTGPAVLSRSYTLARPMVPEQSKWRFTLGFSYAWDDGEAPSVANGVTTFLPATSNSGSLNWSLSGRHSWKHDQIGVAYVGNYSEYLSQYSYNNLSGLNNTLNLDYGHAFSRRLSFHMIESLSDLSQNYSLENPALETGNSVANINLATSPNVQLLNSTVKQSSSSASLIFHQTSRLSYNATVSEFLVEQSGEALVGTTGQQFGGDLNYRWTRKATVGAYYSYTNYLYSHHISQADSHSVGLIYSYALGAHTQLRTRFGATRIESLGFESVPLAPELAAILGQGSVTINAYSLSWTSDISAQLVREFRGRRTASLSFAHGESPGNGFLLTSVQETVSAGYTMALLRRIPLSVGAVYSTLSSTGQGGPNGLDSYRNETAYLSTSRPLGHGVNATFRFDYTRYDLSGTSSLQQHDMRISVGFGWTPSPDLLRF